MERAVEFDDAVVPRICEAIGATTGTDPAAVSPPLYEVVDPDALTRVVKSDGVSEVQFEYAGVTVVVAGDGTVSVDRE